MRSMRVRQSEIAMNAARLVVEEGLEYGTAKRRALRQMGGNARTGLPGNDEVEEAVREHIALFCAATQPHEVTVLRRLALTWMERMQLFRPYLGGAVWHGTATRLSDIFIQLFCDDPKSAEIALIDQRIEFKPGSVQGPQGRPVEALSLSIRCSDLNETIGVHFMIHDLDDLRGALKPDAQGRAPRGDASAVRELLRREAGR